MRWYIIRTLLLKETDRHLADRGAIFLALLLIGASLLVSLFGQDSTQGTSLVGGVKGCYVDYWEDGPWITHLRSSPPEKDLTIRFRPPHRIPTDERGIVVYEENAGAIQIRANGKDENGQPRYLVMFWHPGDPNDLAPYADWFWKETLRFYQGQGKPVEIETALEQVIYPGDTALIHVRPTDASGSSRLKKFLYWRPSDDSGARSLMQAHAPVSIEVQSEELHDHGDLRSKFATALVIFAICFFSIYLMPCLTCEERERGVLLAQVLSPASPLEILAAKFLFYPAFGMALGVLLAGIYSVKVLLVPFFWLSLITIAVAYLGVGLTIASLARTQRMASMGAMCYMLTLAMFLYISSLFNIPIINYFILEYYSPRIMHAALTGSIRPYIGNLVGAIVLAGFWAWLAIRLFRKRGWQ